MNIYALIAPIVIILLIAEMLYSHVSKKKLYNYQDTVANLATGIGNQCINLAVAFFVYKFYGFLYQFAPYKFSNAWYNYLILLVLQDFVFYWFHRTGHSINIFWAAHMPHHSSEELNLSVGIRASFTQRLFQFAFFDWVFPLLGFSPDMVYSVAAVHLLLAYWHHTRVIDKLGWIEKIFVTPSHHRVHHGVNTQYLDKNFSEVFILWDRLFGTFEKEEEPICYGVTKPPASWNPMMINIQFWKQLWDDMMAAPYFIDKIKLWFMPLGWRPRGISDGPIPRIGYTLQEQVKYQSNPIPNTKLFLGVQVALTLVLTTLIINKKLPIETPYRIALCVTLFMNIISWSMILENKKNALLAVSSSIICLYMGFISVCIYNLHMPFLSFPIIILLLLCGISLSWVGYIVSQQKSSTT